MIIVYAWIAFAALGLVFALIARRNAVNELEQLDDEQNGRRRLGRGHVRDETAVAVIDFVWLVIGVFYAFTATNVSNPVVALPLLGTNGILAYTTAMRWLDRRAALHSHDPSVPETQNQREDRQMGDQRRELPSVKHPESREK